MSSLQVGIVGLPNVGKSTLFNALLQKQQAMAANYPFATIEPNVGVVPVSDERLGELARIVKTEKIVPATVKFVDIAGIVKGAAEGEGLGNKFLAHIREVDVVLHVLRDFSDADVVVTGSGDPVEDYVTIETELQIADLETLTNQSEPKGKVEPVELVRWEAVKKLRTELESGKSARRVGLTDKEREAANELFLLTMKTPLYAINVGEEKLAGAESLVRELVDKFARRGYSIEREQVVVICAKVEEELATFTPEDRTAYMKSLGIEESGIDKLVGSSYRTLELMSFLTAGEKEVRAWTVKKGTMAPQAAGVIHSDFEKHFINAKVVKYEDFIKYGGWVGASDAGRVRVQGRGYTMEEGDVVEFVVSV